MPKSYYSVGFMNAIRGLALVSIGCQATNGLDQNSAALTKAQQGAIQQASKNLGVPVRTERMAYFSQAGASLLTAPAANLETIPATELNRGINVAVAYIDDPRIKVPKGFYRVRATADVREVGSIKGRVQLIDANGNVVADLPASVDVRSLTLPDRASTSVTDVVMRSKTDECAGIWTCYPCPNGHTVCYCEGPAVATQ